MKKLFFFLITTLLIASNITSTQKKLQKTKFIISKMNQRLDKIAQKIHQNQIFLEDLNKKIKLLNHKIKILNQELKDSKTKLSTYNDLKKGFEIKSKKIQNEIIGFISDNYFNSIQKTEDISSLIDKEITKSILKRYSQKINSLIQKNKKILTQIAILNKKIDEIKQKQNILLQTKEKLALLKKAQQKKLIALNKEKAKYKKRLQTLIERERRLQNKLADLKIIKKRKPQNLNVNINVKKYGSLYFKPKIANYKGPKTIPPLKGKIIKKFGSYIDPIYKIKIYNDSISIKPFKPNSVVRSVLSGRVVYVGESNGKGVVIIKHKNNLFTIYANLDRISPILKKGAFVKKGQIIARVKDTLEFEVTYKEKPINPIKIIAFK